MNIGTDLDDCIVNTAELIVMLLNIRFNKCVDVKDAKSYNLEVLYPDVPDNVVKYAVSDVISLATVPLVEVNADYYINRLSSYYNTVLHVITYRPNDVYRSTLQLLQDNLIKNFKLHFVSGKNGRYTPTIQTPDKAKLINDLELNIYIEDRPDIIEDILDKTKCQIIVYERPWNKGKFENSERLQNCKTWKDINELLIPKGE
jgi:hypothetical protein